MRSEIDPARGEAREIVVAVVSAADGRRILHVQLNRPEKRNALTLAMLEELHRWLAQVVEEIVITSAGPSFCAGLDLDECHRDPAWPRPLRHLESLASVYRGLLNSPATVIAIVQGFAVGGGLGLALCADEVIAVEDARLRLPNEGELGLLARIVWPLVEARQIARRGAVAWQAGELDASAAQTAGLVDHVVKPMEFATQRERVSCGVFSSSARIESWRAPERRGNTERAMRAMLASLSR
jgi:enoyl-CoA hydratase/carnithine racemase